MLIEILILKIETMDLNKKTLKKVRDLILKLSNKTIMSRAQYLKNEAIKKEILKIIDEE